MAPSGARPSTGPEKRSAPRAGQRLAGAVARRWRPPARSLRGRDRRYSARVSLVSVEVVVLGAGERATRRSMGSLSTPPTTPSYADCEVSYERTAQPL